jgi:predicted nucleotidyltransferase
MTPARFSAEQIRAVGDLRTLWGPDSMVLVGASALGCFMDLSWRQTHDLDLSVSMTIDEYPGSLPGLPGWKSHPAREHEWLSPDGVRVDILPSAARHLEAEEIIWPKSGLRMSLIGIGLACERSRSVHVVDDLWLRVAPPAVIALLKIVAYKDRPSAREKDLEDLGHLLEHYLRNDDDRRYSREVLELELDFEDVSAFLLGRDMGEIVGDLERQTVASFVAGLRDEQDSGATQARMLRLGPATWRNSHAVLLDRLRAFDLGFVRRSD